ncbi:MAG TPA: BON domain-containing protein [Pseudoclavibacter sp.]|nr:BON domain-containing protein [Pseudoclavibacter sp.]
MTDKDIQQAVLRELEWEPMVKSTEIGVAVKDGIVTLSGFVDSYSKRYNAERAAKRVYGVKAVVNDLEVHLPTSSERTDEDIARAAVRALEDRITVPRDRIKVTVSNGWITLEGEVEWQYEREAANSAVRHLTGVKGVTNLITITPRVSPTEIRTKIEEALRRSAEMDARRIAIETEGSKVILRGRVRSWAERDEAERAAWRAPGVNQVENHITVEP